MESSAGQEFRDADPLGRAVILLRDHLPDSHESFGRRSIASRISEQTLGPPDRIVTTSIASAGSPRGQRDEVVRLVSEGLQVLEQARLICPDLTETREGWWMLTSAGRQAKNSSDPAGMIELRLGGAL